MTPEIYNQYLEQIMRGLRRVSFKAVIQPTRYGKVIEVSNVNFQENHAVRCDVCQEPQLPAQLAQLLLENHEYPSNPFVLYVCRDIDACMFREALLPPGKWEP